MRKTYYIVFVIASLLSLSLIAQKKNTAAPKRSPIDTNKFVLVEGGTFMMGTDQPVELAEAPAHQVSVKSFYMAKTETTFEDFDRFTSETKRDSAPSGTWGRGKKPVFMVSWFDAVEYCNWLSKKEKLSACYVIKGSDVKYLDTAKGYRLPTEAEWEFAGRGGNKSKGNTYAGNNVLEAIGWVKTNSGGETMPVAQKWPNELGLYDMTGNVWEWVWDIYDFNYYKNSPTDNPKGADAGPYRVMRGGGWYNEPNYSRLVTRQNNAPTFKQNSVGFRVARTYY